MIAITNATIVTMDAQESIVEDGALVIEGSRIVAVGDRREMAEQHDLSDAIDGRGGLITPGLIDSHLHPFNYLVGGHGDDLEIGDLLYRVFYPFEQHVTEDEAYLGASAAYAELIRSGVTCFNDPGGYMPDQIAQAAADVGIRGIVSRSTRDLGDHYGVESTEVTIRKATEVVERWNGACDGRIRGWFGIRMALNASDALISEIARLAADHGVGLHSHAAAARFEKAKSEALFGKGTLQRFDALGALRPNLLAVHMGFIEDDEIPLLAERDVKVAHCPIASMAGAWGIISGQKIPAMIERGITVSVGSDTNFGAGSLDMVRQLFFLAIGHREAHGKPDLIGADQAFRMATRNGARALLWEDEIGSLEPGKKADLVLFDRDRVEWHYPGRGPVSSLVYGASRADIRSVMVDGKFLMKDRTLTTIDEAEIVSGLKRYSGHGSVGAP